MESVKKAVKEVTGASIGCAVVMIVLGLLAVILPHALGIAVSVVFAWLIVFSGVVYLAFAFTSLSAGRLIWRLMIGAVYILGGGYLAFHPGIALESLTVVLAVVFALEAMLELTSFFMFRLVPGSGWVLFDALVTLLLAGLILYPWPSSSTWAIGIILGVNLIFSGVTVLLYSVAARKTMEVLNP
jgi:uncharacterized membrane protein HdeD (DUF308 family)